MSKNNYFLINSLKHLHFCKNIEIFEPQITSGTWHILKNNNHLVKKHHFSKISNLLNLRRYAGTYKYIYIYIYIYLYIYIYIHCFLLFYSHSFWAQLDPSRWYVLGCFVSQHPWQLAGFAETFRKVWLAQTYYKSRILKNTWRTTMINANK